MPLSSVVSLPLLLECHAAEAVDRQSVEEGRIFSRRPDIEIAWRFRRYPFFVEPFHEEHKTVKVDFTGRWRSWSNDYRYASGCRGVGDGLGDLQVFPYIFTIILSSVAVPLLKSSILADAAGADIVADRDVDHLLVRQRCFVREKIICAAAKFLQAMLQARREIVPLLGAEECRVISRFILTKLYVVLEYAEPMAK